MRTKNTLVNTIAAIISSILMATLTFLVRALFVKIFPVDLLGYEGFFTNVFQLFSIADLGVGAIVLYRLYSAFAIEDEKRIAFLVRVNQFVYSLVGFLILVIGLVLVPFLPRLFKDTTYEWRYLYLIYGLQLINVLSAYFLAYRRILFVAGQQVYQCTIIETICSILTYIVRIIGILAFKSYIIYLLASLITNFLSNTLIFLLSKRRYSFVSGYKERVSLKRLKEEGIISDLKNNTIQQLSLVIYGGTDSILSTLILGPASTGLMSNYLMVSAYVNRFASKLLDAIQGSVGNYVYTMESESRNKLFRMFDMISFFIASFALCSYLALLNPFVTIWLGNSFSLDFLFVVALSVNQYISFVHYFAAILRNTCGRYELDRPFLLIGAIANVLFSIILAWQYGLSGIMIGTAIGHFFFWIGRIRTIYKTILTDSIMRYIGIQLRNVIWAAIEVGITLSTCSLCKDGIIGLIQRMCICIIIPWSINIARHYKTEEFKMMKYYFKVIRKKE